MADLSHPEDAREPRFRKIFAVSIVVIFSLLFLRMVAPFLQAVLLAAVLAGLLYPLFRWLARRLPSRPLASILTVLIVFFAIVLPILLLVGVFAREALRLSETAVPLIEEQLQDQDGPRQLPLWVPFGHLLEPYRDQILERLGDLMSRAGTFLVDSVSTLTQSTLLFVLNLFIMLYTMFFFFMAGSRWLEIFDYLPLTQQDKRLIAEKGVSIARATLKGTVVIGIVQGTLTGIGFAAAGIPSAFFWAVITAFASLVPGVGSALVWVPGVIYVLLSGEVMWGLGLAVWGTVIVSGSDNILRPWLVGSDTKMPDVLILLSTLGGIAMFGPTGIILGPILAGFFITSWHIFSGTFRRELERAESSPALLDEETEGLAEPEAEAKS